ncbi:MAG TPA: c-type cytochrome [Pseudomonadales bacterium]|nr:c-type cytochrome [Pseudomonadales bacterium]
MKSAARIGRSCLATGAVVLALAAGACSEPPTDGTPLQDTTQIADRDPAAPGPDGRSIQSLWARSCALCHADGTGGAPRFGDALAWAPRLAQGEATLLVHTLDGLGNMPPLGYCMDCSAEEFVHLIRYMTPQGTGR